MDAALNGKDYRRLCSLDIQYHLIFEESFESKLEGGTNAASRPKLETTGAVVCVFGCALQLPLAPRL